MGSTLLEASPSMRGVRGAVGLTRALQPGLVPIAGAVWLWNLFLLIG